MGWSIGPESVCPRGPRKTERADELAGHDLDQDQGVGNAGTMSRGSLVGVSPTAFIDSVDSKQTNVCVCVCVITSVGLDR